MSATDDANLVERIQLIAEDAAEWMRRGEPLPEAHQRAVIRFLDQLAYSKPVNVYQLFGLKPGRNPQRKPAPLRRRAHFMREFDGKTVDEVAAALELPRSTAEHYANIGKAHHNDALTKHQQRSKKKPL